MSSKSNKRGRGGTKKRIRKETRREDNKHIAGIEGEEVAWS